MAAWRRKKGEDGPSPEELKNVPPGIDSTTFFAPLIPLEVRAAVPLLHGLDQDTFRSHLSASLELLRGRGVTRVDDSAVESMASLSESAQGLDSTTVVTGLYVILRSIIRNRIKSAVAERDLLEMHVPQAAVADMVRAVKVKRLEMEKALVAKRITFPTVDKLKWRVDVTISSSAVTRVLKPTVIMQLFLSDGSIKTFEVPVAQFHQLRYKAAKVLHSLQELERHPIVRLVKSLEAERQKVEA